MLPDASPCPHRLDAHRRPAGAAAPEHQSPTRGTEGARPSARSSCPEAPTTTQRHDNVAIPSCARFTERRLVAVPISPAPPARMIRPEKPGALVRSGDTNSARGSRTVRAGVSARGRGGDRKQDPDFVAAPAWACGPRIPASAGRRQAVDRRKNVAIGEDAATVSAWMKKKTARRKNHQTLDCRAVPCTMYPCGCGTPICLARWSL